MIKSLIIGGLALGLLSWILSACSGRTSTSESSQRRKVMVSIPPQQFFIDNIAGDRVEVKCLVNVSADPETFEPSVTQLKDLATVDAYLPIGTLPFEHKLVEIAKKNGGEVYCMSEDIALLYGTHSHRHHDVDGEHGHEHGAPDPHVWSSARNAKTMALNALNALVAVDAANEDIYRANYARLDQRLDSIDMAFKRCFETYPQGAAFLVWHPSLSYFARDYGLNQISLNQEGKETSVNGYIKQLERAKSSDAVAFFIQQDFDTSRARSMASDAGITLTEINPMNAEWEDEMQKLYDAFTINKH